MGRVVVYLDSNPKESDIASIIRRYEERVKSREGFAEWLNSAHLDSNPTNLAVGPPDGFSDELKQSADQLISLSDLTLTHEMAAALLMEQLYRASEIIRGSAYHRN